MTKVLNIGIEVEVDDKGSVTKIRNLNQEVGKTEEAGRKGARGFDMMTTAIIGLGSALTIAKIGKLLKGTIDASAEQQEVFNHLAASMSRVGEAFNENASHLQNYFSVLQETTRFGDTDTAGALDSLINITGDYNSALKLLGPSIDFAAAMQTDLYTATRLVGRAASGMTDSLSEYGIVLDEATKKQLQSASAMEKTEIVAGILNEKFGGAAQADLETYAGRIAQLGNYWSDFQEAIGDVVTKLLATPEAFEAVRRSLETLTEWAKTFGETLAFVFNLDFEVGLSLGLDGAIGAVKLKMRDLYLTMAKLPGEVGDRFFEMALEINEEIAKISDTIETSTDFQNAKAAAEAFRAAVDNLTTPLGDVKNDLDDVAEANPFAKMNADVDALLARGKEFVKQAKEWSEQAAELESEAMETAAENAAEALKDSMDDVWKDITATIENDPIEFGPDHALKKLRESWKQTLDDMRTDAVLRLGDLFSSLFTGQFEDLSQIGTAFLENMAQDWGNQLAAALTAATEGYYDEDSDQTVSGGAAFDALGGRDALIGLAGSAAAAWGQQQGGAGGAAATVLGGAASGFASGGVWGAVLGGVSGLLSLIGGQDQPRVYGNLGLDGHQVYQHDTDLSVGARAVWAQERIAEYRASINSMNDVLRIFGDADLFDLIKDAPEFQFDDEDLGDITAVFADKWLPKAMRQMFRGALDRGLRNFGVEEEAIKKLWEEVHILGNADQLEALETFVTAIVRTSKLLDEAEWGNLEDAAGKSPFTLMLEQINEAVGQIDLTMAGWDNMSMVDRASELLVIDDIFQSVLDNVITMLGQIQQRQEEIQYQWARFAEDVVLDSFTNDEDKLGYLQEQAAYWQDMLSNAETPDEIERANSELARYLGAIRGMVDVNADGPGGMTWGEWLIEQAHAANEAAQEAYSGVTDELRDAYDSMVDSVIAARDALDDFTDSLVGGPEGPDLPDGGGSDGGRDPWDYRKIPEWFDGDTKSGRVPIVVDPPVVVVNVENHSGFPLRSYVAQIVQETIGEKRAIG